MWVRLLLRKYVGVVVNSGELQAICARLQKYICRRVEMLPILASLKTKIPAVQSKT